MSFKKFFPGQAKFYSGQRLSLDGALCTVRYFGILDGTKGQWLGVEWDDPSRGKHDGQHQGKSIFKCQSRSPTAASFIRPSRSTDQQRSFLDAVRFKYGGELPPVTPNGKSGGSQRSQKDVEPLIEISGKAVEEIGFDRVRQQQAVLENLKIVVVDSLCIAGNSDSNITNEQHATSQCCPNILELDLGWNPLETLQDIADICTPLRKLKILKLSGLRLQSWEIKTGNEATSPFQLVEELHFNECLLEPEQVSEVISIVQSFFPALKTLSISSNELADFPSTRATNGIIEVGSVLNLNLENNMFDSLAILQRICASFPRLKTLSMQGNKISHIGLPINIIPFTYPGLDTLDLSRNNIPDYKFLDEIPTVFPNLIALRVSQNPLYNLTATSDKSRQSDAAFFLILARIKSLESLNYTTITSRDREEGEIYYLSVAGKDIEPSLRAAGSDPTALAQAVLAARIKYPRYEELCGTYERESLIARYLSAPLDASTTSANLVYAPGTLGSRLIKATFHLSSPSSQSPVKEFTRLLPRTIDIYRLKALVARELHLQPLQFKLIYESPELDPVRDDINKTSDWHDWGNWDVDSSPSSEDIEANAKERWVDGVLYRDGGKWKRREIELLDGFREWGFWIEDGVEEAKVRVEA